MRAADALAAMRELPEADLDTIDGGEAALLLAPHADDESLGCGSHDLRPRLVVQGLRRLVRVIRFSGLRRRPMQLVGVRRSVRSPRRVFGLSV